MRGNYISDEELEARLQGLRLNDPNLRCPADRRITGMCISSECQSTALICKEEDCTECRCKHQLCPSIHLSDLTRSLNRKSSRFEVYVKKAFQIENSFMDQLQDRRDKLIKEYHLKDIERQDLALVKQIYQKKDWKTITGRMAAKLLDGIKTEEKERTERSETLLEKYRKQLGGFTEEIVDIQTKLYEELTIKQKKGDILDSIIFTKDKKGEEDFQFLRASLKQPKKIELLYRGSQNQFRAGLFHQKCDNTPDTFTLLRTEFGKVIGGFSHYAWNAVEEDFVNDEGRNAFLLSFDLKQKMVPNSHQHLIYCHPNCGPRFGGGADLFLADRCNQNNNSYASIPYSYNFEGKYKNGSQESWKAFSGATDGNNFKVLEYEVFRVRYE